MTTVRLPLEMEQRLQILSISKHKSKSDIIKEALELFLKNENEEKDSYELGLEYFGKYGSGNVAPDKNYKKLVKEKIRAKHNPH